MNPLWTDIYLAAGGALGALARQVTDKKRPTLSWETIVDMGVGAAVLIAVSALGVLPQDVKTAMLENPVRTVFLAALAGMGSANYARTLLKRFGFLNGPNGGTGTAAKVGVLLLLAAGLAGCGTLGLQSASVSFPRDDVLLLYADLKADWREGAALLARDCAAKTIPAETCTRLGALRDRFASADQVFQTGVRAKREVSLQDLQGLLGLASQLGRLAGYPIPALGTPR